MTELQQYKSTVEPVLRQALEVQIKIFSTYELVEWTHGKEYEDLKQSITNLKNILG